jgi:hypothetical protein
MKLNTNFNFQPPSTVLLFAFHKNGIEEHDFEVTFPPEFLENRLTGSKLSGVHIDEQAAW